jgi:GR25 family glycosyltransferase involved in LPS biosynthesis
MEKAYVINLDRSKNRFKKIKQRLDFVNLPFEKFNAIDGSKLSNQKITNLVHPICSNLICSRGMIGCAMSHYLLWKKMVDENKEWMLILEDDAIPALNIVERLKRLKDLIKTHPNLFKRPTIINLHCLGDSYENNNNNMTLNGTKLEKNYVLETFMKLASFITHKQETHKVLKYNDIEIHTGKMQVSLLAYLINLDGAKKLIEMVETKGIRYHIDFSIAMNYNITGYCVYKPFFYSVNEPTLLSNSFTFPMVPSLLFSNYNSSLEWMFNEPFIGNISVGIFIYLMILIILWLMNKQMKYTLITMLILELTIYLIVMTKEYSKKK